MVRFKVKYIQNTKKLNHNVKILAPKDQKRFPFVAKREILKLFNLKYDSERKNILSKIYSKNKNIIHDSKVDLILHPIPTL